MIDAIDGEVPHANQALISIGIYFICIYDLVCDKLMSFAAFKFHLFLEKLILICIGASFASLVRRISINSPLLVSSSVGEKLGRPVRFHSTKGHPLWLILVFYILSANTPAIYLVRSRLVRPKVLIFQLLIWVHWFVDSGHLCPQMLQIWLSTAAWKLCFGRC